MHCTLSQPERHKDLNRETTTSMQASRFRTVQRPDQQGRVAVVFQPINKGQVLCVSLLESQNLFNNRLSEKGMIQARVFLLPAEPHKVAKALLAKRPRLRSSPYKQFGSKHYASNSPTFQEVRRCVQGTMVARAMHRCWSAFESGLPSCLTAHCE